MLRTVNLVHKGPTNHNQGPKPYKTKYRVLTEQPSVDTRIKSAAGPRWAEGTHCQLRELGPGFRPWSTPAPPLCCQPAQLLPLPGSASDRHSPPAPLRKGELLGPRLCPLGPPTVTELQLGLRRYRAFCPRALSAARSGGSGAARVPRPTRPFPGEQDPTLTPAPPEPGQRGSRSLSPTSCSLASSSPSGPRAARGRRRVGHPRPAHRRWRRQTLPRSGKHSPPRPCRRARPAAGTPGTPLVLNPCPARFRHLPAGRRSQAAGASDLVALTGWEQVKGGAAVSSSRRAALEGGMGKTRKNSGRGNGRGPAPAMALPPGPRGFRAPTWARSGADPHLRRGRRGGAVLRLRRGGARRDAG